MSKKIVIGIDESGNSLNYKNIIHQIKNGNFKKENEKLSIVFIVIDFENVENIFEMRNKFKVNNNFFKKIHTHDLNKEILKEWIKLISNLNINFIYKTLNLNSFYEKYGWNSRDPYIYLMERFFQKVNNNYLECQFFIETRSLFYDLKTINFILDISLNNKKIITSKIKLLDKKTYEREYVFIEIADTILYLYLNKDSIFLINNEYKKTIIKIFNKRIK